MICTLIYVHFWPEKNIEIAMNLFYGINQNLS